LPPSRSRPPLPPFPTRRSSDLQLAHFSCGLTVGSSDVRKEEPDGGRSTSTPSRSTAIVPSSRFAMAHDKSHRGRVMRRSIMALATIAAAIALAAGFASSAGAYGGGASHDTWQVGLSFNCNNPAYCEDELGGFWGWVEFDRSGGQTWGDAEFAGCGHTTGGGGPGSAGAGHISIEITSWTFGAPTPDDPNYGLPGAQEFYITGNEVTSSF